ncbi:unnamed protein product [Caenorhabditis bovis]|uniref:Uncharacterized protein n=1 Tax=Caenorhabditis bovis TaxID=2654633 RepID=A0A8S1EPM9_9PELO|nr:unnamed protein product [Caenorhabditis bovis]
MYTMRRSSSMLINGEAARLQEATRRMESLLRSLDLPERLDVVLVTDPYSETARAKIAKTKSLIAEINDLFAESTRILQSNQTLLDEATSSLNYRRYDYDRYNLYDYGWSPRYSYLGYEEHFWRIPLLEKTKKYEGILSEVSTNQQKDKNRFEDLLRKETPYVEFHGELESVQKLRALLASWRNLKTERDRLEQYIFSAKSLTANNLINALAETNLIQKHSNPEDVTSTLMSRLREKVEVSLIDQNKLVDEIQCWHSRLMTERTNVTNYTLFDEVYNELVGVRMTAIERNKVGNAYIGRE